MPGYRAERASQQIHQQVSMMFERGVSDPRLVGVNVTRVQVSGDLRNAKIFVAPMRGDEQATRDMMDALDRASGYFRRQIALALDLKFAPEIRFILDHAIEKGEHFLQVLEQVQAEEQEHAKKGKRRTNG
jgi:ribosome-binding factor A